MIEKTLVIFANSRKESGRCIAGKDIDTGKWIRPISAEEHGELDNSYLPIELLEKFNIEFLKHQPWINHQPENYLISHKIWETATPKIERNDIENFLDKPNNLWLYGSYRDKKNDYVLYKSIKDGSISIEQSLYLIKVNNLVYTHNTNNYRMKGVKQWRAQFIYNEVKYDLAVTDDNWTKVLDDIVNCQYQMKNSPYLIIDIKQKLPHPVIEIKNYSYLVISLGNEYKPQLSTHKYGFCYKLVAAVL